MPKTNRKYCTPPVQLRLWLEQEARRLNISEAAILVLALDRYQKAQGGLSDQENRQATPY